MMQSASAKVGVALPPVRTGRSRIDRLHRQLEGAGRPGPREEQGGREGEEEKEALAQGIRRVGGSPRGENRARLLPSPAAVVRSAR